jgi:drug/metabolite transporter (DMT)-like permease
LVAVAGTIVLIAPGAGLGGDASVLGDLLALAGAVTAAGYLVVGRTVRTRLALGPYLGGVHLVAAALLGVTALLSLDASDFASVSLPDVLAVVYLGLVPGVVGHGLLNWAARRVPVHMVSLAILLEPVGATALAALVVGSSVGFPEVCGAAIVLVGVGLALSRRSVPVSRAVPVPEPSTIAPRPPPLRSDLRRPPGDR